MYSNGFNRNIFLNYIYSIIVSHEREYDNDDDVIYLLAFFIFIETNV